jgi:hypothetical protein
MSRAYEHSPCRRLVREIIHRASMDAHGGTQEAMAWLLSQDARYWADLLGLERWPPPIPQLPVKNTAPQALIAQGAD